MCFECKQRVSSNAQCVPNKLRSIFMVLYSAVDEGILAKVIKKLTQ